MSLGRALPLVIALLSSGKSKTANFISFSPLQMSRTLISKKCIHCVLLTSSLWLPPPSPSCWRLMEDEEKSFSEDSILRKFAFCESDTNFQFKGRGRFSALYDRSALKAMESDWNWRLDLALLSLSLRRLALLYLWGPHRSFQINFFLPDPLMAKSEICIKLISYLIVSSVSLCKTCDDRLGFSIGKGMYFLC